MWPSTWPQGIGLFANGTAIIAPAMICNGYCEHPDLRVYSLSTLRLGTLQYLGINTQRGVDYTYRTIDGRFLCYREKLGPGC